MQIWFFASVLGASFVGSLHCAAMCGPFAALAATPDASGHRRAGLFAYHASRAVAYSGLGLLAGALGTAVDAALSRPGTVRVAAVLSAIVVLAVALFAVPAVARRARALVPAAWLPDRRRLVQLGRAPLPVRGAALGFLTPLLPCAWLYSFVALAAGTGSPLAGGLTMLSFWGGSLPALLGVSAVAHRLGAVARARFAVATTLAVCALAFTGIWRRGGAALDAPHADAAVDERPRCH